MVRTGAKAWLKRTIKTKETWTQTELETLYCAEFPGSPVSSLRSWLSTFARQGRIVRERVNRVKTIRVVNGTTPAPVPPVVPPPPAAPVVPASPRKGRRHKKLDAILRKVRAGVPVMLVGPTGSGKTHLCAQVAEELALDFTFNSMSEGVSESALVGRMLPQEDGSWAYQPSPFVETYENGGVHLFDEVDAADPNLMITVNAAIANGQLSLPFAQVEPIKRHENCILIAAANTFGRGADRQYVGRNGLDEATLNRFTMGTIEVDYDRDLEMELVSEMIGTEKANELLSWAWAIRDRIEQHKMRRVISTRNVLDAAKLMRAGENLAEISETFFLSWSRDERAKVT